MDAIEFLTKDLIS